MGVDEVGWVIVAVVVAVRWLAFGVWDVGFEC